MGEGGGESRQDECPLLITSVITPSPLREDLILAKKLLVFNLANKLSKQYSVMGFFFLIQKTFF